MTALEQYIRLEAIGFWRETPDSEAREVIVSFGNATLMLRDGSDAALTHWALSATHVVDLGEDGTIYSPDPDATETLRIADREMIEAIAKVAAARTPRLPTRRQRNWLVVLLLVLAIAGLTAALGPDLLKTYTASRISPLNKQAIAGEMLREIERTRGPACELSEAAAIFRNLGARVLPGATIEVAVVPLAGAATASLPGGRILLDPGTLRRMKNPEELVGWIVQEILRADRMPPMSAMLQSGSLRVTIDLLSSGTLDPNLIRQFARGIGAPGSIADAALDEALLRTLSAAGLPSLPFATAIAREGGAIDRVRRLRAGNTIAAGAEFDPALSDQDWVLLKGICGA